MTEILKPSKIDRRFRFWLRDYGLLLQEELDEFARGSGTRHAIAIDAAPNTTTVQVTFLHGDPYGQQKMPKFVEEKVREGYQALRAAEGPGVVMLRVAEAAVDCPCGITVDWDAPVTITHPSTPHAWSNVQAWEDTNDIIAKILLCRPASS